MKVIAMPNPSASSANSVAPIFSDQEFDELVSTLRKTWTDYKKVGIEARHEMGRLLNKKLGNPGDRQPYGKEVIPRIARALGLHVSEISRFRKFAAKYSCVWEFTKNYPNLKSWTQIRESLTISRKSTKGRRRDWALVRSLKSALATLRSDLRLDDKRSDEIANLVQELIDAVCRRDDLPMLKTLRTKLMDD